MYDLVILIDEERQIAEAFAEAFIAREERLRVALVLPRTDTLRPRVRRLREYLDLSEIGLIEGHARPDAPGDQHYLDVDGRLVYGERIMTLAAA